MNSDFINEEKPVDQTEYGVNNVYIVNSRVDIFGQGQAVTNKVSFKFYVHVLTIQFYSRGIIERQQHKLLIIGRRYPYHSSFIMFADEDPRVETSYYQ